jgi:hypothetical protein
MRLLASDLRVVTDGGNAAASTAPNRRPDLSV